MGRIVARVQVLALALGAPGLFLVGEYTYQTRHQGSFDFASGGVTTTGFTRDSRAQGILFATVVNW